MWVPSHVELAGNSVADSAAKANLLLPVYNLTVPHLDYKLLIRIQTLRQWQLRCNSKTEKKLHSIEPRVNVISMMATNACSGTRSLKLSNVEPG